MVGWGNDSVWSYECYAVYTIEDGHVLWEQGVPVLLSIVVN